MVSYSAYNYVRVSMQCVKGIGYSIREYEHYPLSSVITKRAGELVRTSVQFTSAHYLNLGQNAVHKMCVIVWPAMATVTKKTCLN